MSRSEGGTKYRYQILPAQPGWEVIEVNWSNFDDPSSFVIAYRCPVVAWQIQSQLFPENDYREEHMFSVADPVWQGGHDFGERGDWALLGPDGRVCCLNDQFNSVRDYAIWDWLKLKRSEDGVTAEDKALVAAYAERYKVEIKAVQELINSWRWEEEAEAAREAREKRKAAMEAV